MCNRIAIWGDRSHVFWHSRNELKVGYKLAINENFAGNFSNFVGNFWAREIEYVVCVSEVKLNFTQASVARLTGFALRHNVHSKQIPAQAHIIQSWPSKSKPFVMHSKILTMCMHWQ